MNIIVGERVAFLRLMTENREFIAVVAVETIFRPKPHVAVPVLCNGMHGALGEPFLDREKFEWGIDCLSGCEGGCGQDERRKDDCRGNLQHAKMY